MDTANPYQNPSQHAGTENLAVQEFAEDLGMLTFQGRLGRLRFFVNCMTLGVLVTIANSFMVAGAQAQHSRQLALLSVVITIGLMALFALMQAARRFRDLGITPWAALSIAIPVIGLLVQLYLLLAPGNPGDNSYGLPPAPYGKKTVALAVVFGLLLTIGIAQQAQLFF